MSSPKVTYSYADGSANTIRPTGVTYPDNTGGTRVLTFDYGASGGMNDRLSRVENLGFGGTSNLVQPSYLGLGTQVRTNYTQPQVRWDLATGSGANPYAGLDRFGRVIDNKWTNYNTSATLDQIKYTYDRASNRTTRENVVAKAQTTPKYFDELYGYDGSNRLTQMQRGQLAGTTGITNLQFQQDWSLDPTGNWREFTQDSNGAGTNDLVQARTANPVNEITDITNSVGSPWVQQGYDAAGNMTTIPQGNEPEEGFTGVYDAWNRLVKLLDEDGNVVAEYAYDGLTRRIKKTTAAETRHYFYNASWQILEERVGSATTYDRQYLWGLRYIDDCVLRDKSGGARLYALQDANWNVDALVDTSGAVLERFSYSAYGLPTFLNPDFTEKMGSDYAWDVLYAGYKWDEESGMYQVRWRYLLPVIGNWVTRDPIGYFDSRNLQLYVKNQPIDVFDSFGLVVTQSPIPGVQYIDNTALKNITVANLILRGKNAPPKEVAAIMKDIVNKTANFKNALRSILNRKVNTNTYYVSDEKLDDLSQFIEHSVKFHRCCSINIFIGHGPYSRTNPDDPQSLEIPSPDAILRIKEKLGEPNMLCSSRFGIFSCGAGIFNSEIAKNNLAAVDLDSTGFLDVGETLEKFTNHAVELGSQVDELIRNCGHKALLNLYIGQLKPLKDNSVQQGGIKELLLLNDDGTI